MPVDRLAENEQKTAAHTSFYAGISYFIVFVGQNIWRSTFHNFAIENFQISAVQIGVAFSLVSLPGLFSVALGFIGPKAKLTVWLVAAFLMISLGLFGTGTAPSWGLLLFSVLILHCGFAVYYPTINTIFLLTVNSRQAVKRLSSLKSLGPLAGVISAALMLIALAPWGYVPILASCGGAILLSGLGVLSISPQAKGRQTKIRFKKSLTAYYLLNFLNGCRSALFRTFVLYYLITEFNFDFKNTAAIVLAGNGLTFIGYQLIGRLTKHVPPPRLLILLYLVMCFNFLGFWWLKQIELLTLIFLLDSLVFCTSAITDGYLKIVSDSKELLGDLAAGVSLYHLGGVMMPIAGGVIYARSDINAFFIGSLCALLSVWVTITLMRPAFDFQPRTAN